MKIKGERGKNVPEFELLDTGAFDQDAYFDVFIEYAKNTPDDLLIKITVHNHGSHDAALNVLPTVYGSAIHGIGAMIATCLS